MQNSFGMFIHWGIYALTEYHEQALAKLDMAHEEYEALANRFTAERYDPEEWVKMAKDAGMRYICFTAKHHDGFCMWDTKHTDYKITRTPFGKDALRMLADACEKHGMKLSLYYSCPDWHHENAYNSRSTHQWKSVHPEKADRARYVEYVMNQITELLTNYGPIYTLFWDIPPRFTDERVNALARRLQPGIRINNRGYDAGDFSTPERYVPEGARFETPTEACESVGEQSWGYRADEDYFSLRYLLSSIDKVMAMGGSYLLNAGPMANGRIGEKTRALFSKIGNWYNRMEGSLTDTEADPFPYKLSLEQPFVALRKSEKTYLHFYQGVHSSAITFLNLPGLPAAARLMNDGRPLRVRLDKLPALTGAFGEARGPFASIADIPADDFPQEPIVIEIAW